MSWGERSCLNRSNCPVVCTIDTCNVDCIAYKSNGQKPDSRPTFKREFAARPVSDPLKGLNREQRRALKTQNQRNFK